MSAASVYAASIMLRHRRAQEAHRPRNGNRWCIGLHQLNMEDSVAVLSNCRFFKPR